MLYEKYREGIFGHLSRNNPKPNRPEGHVTELSGNVRRRNVFSIHKNDNKLSTNPPDDQ